MGTIFWLIVVVGILALVQVKYYNKIGLKKLSYTREFDKEAVFEGEKVNLVETISNRKLTPLPWLRVESKISPWLKFKTQENLDILSERFHRSVFFLFGYSRITRKHEISCIKRGYYDLSLANISVGDLFGMNTTSREYIGNVKLFVYPRILKESDLSDEALKWQGDITVKRWILPDPILVNGIREYRPGDSQKDIHWKASARTGTLQVKTRDYTVSPRVLIVFNTEPEEAFWGIMSDDEAESMEIGLRHVSTFANWAVQKGIDVGLYCNGTTTVDKGNPISIAPACSTAHLELILQTLAATIIKQQEAIHLTLERLIGDNIGNLDILVLSTYWGEAMQKRADKLRSLGNSVTYVPLRREVINFAAETEDDI